MRYCYAIPHPAVTTDIVIFTIRDQCLNLLLVKRKGLPEDGKWALPGGYINLDQDLETCALRELKQETGIKVSYLEQLYTFGEPKRDPRQRVISVAYYALIAADKLNLKVTKNGEQVAWFPLDQCPVLAFDHDEITSIARQRLAAKLDYSTIGFQFMPEEFTLSELQSVYEIISNAVLDKRNFRKWINSLDRIEETKHNCRQGRHRPAKLYRVKQPAVVEIIR